MLVVTRKIHEKIIIAGNIEIQVLEISQGKVRLGITAPANITINREEIHKMLHLYDAEDRHEG